MPVLVPASWRDGLEQDLTKNLLTVLRDNAGMSATAALRKVTMEMLANNPFVPPTSGCPVNDLPNELLAYIFFLGTEIENEEEFFDANEDEDDESEYADALDLERDWEDEDMEENNEDDDPPVLPFQVLVSHVCRHWREIALESPVLWTRITFTKGSPFEKSVTWIQRSKSSPLNISIDCTIDDSFEYTTNLDNVDSHGRPTVARLPDSHGKKYEEEHGGCNHPATFFSLDELSTILDIIVPHVSQWRVLDCSVTYYVYMHNLLSHLSHCPPAPLLEVLSLHHYEDNGDDGEIAGDKFYPPELSTRFLIFNGIVPNLRQVTLWGVHLDWDRSLSFLAGLEALELAYHAKNVRPSFATFSKILQESPELNTLTLCVSGPADHDDVDNDWGTEPIVVLSVTDLVLCYQEPKYIIALMRLLCTPNVTSLVLDYDGADYSEFAQALTKPMPGKSKSLLAGLEHLKIAGLPCNKESAEIFLDQLAALQSLNLNCAGDEEELFFDLLWQPLGQSATQSKTYCPNLNTIWTSGIYGQQMKTLIEKRQAAGVPIKRVFMNQDDDVGEKEEKWIKDHVETFEFFQPSDFEDDDDDVDDDDGVSDVDSDGDPDEDPDEMYIL